MFSNTSSLTSSISGWFKDVSDTLQGPSIESTSTKEESSEAMVNTDAQQKQDDKNKPDDKQVCHFNW